MITQENLKNFLWQAVELTDCDGNLRKGWFVIRNNKEYVLLPFDDMWHNYIYKVSHIKKIKFLINGYEISQ